MQLSHLWLRTRHKINRWKYDGEKLYERFMYGQPKQQHKVTIPFMVTGDMKQRLVSAGFPSQLIAHFTPSDAHSILTHQWTYLEYMKNKNTSLEEGRQEKQDTLTTIHAEQAHKALEVLSEQHVESSLTFKSNDSCHDSTDKKIE